MMDSKFVKALVHLDRHERNRFRKFLDSPFFNADENLVLLFAFIDNQLAKNPIFLPERETLWKRVFRGLPYDDVRLRKYLSDLLRHLSQFLSFDHYQRDPLAQELILLEVIRDRKLKGLSNTSLKRAKTHAANKPLRNAQTYLQAYHLQRSLFEIQNFEEDRDLRSNIEEISENLDLFYLAEKLRLYSDALALQKMTPHTYRLLHEEEVLRMTERAEYQQIPAISVYSRLLKLYTNPDDEENYFSLRRFLSENNPLFPRNELTEIYSTIINYCTIKINYGSRTFLSDLFEFYQEVVSQDILIEDRSFSPWHFRNIVTIGLRLGEFRWTESFIQDYAPLLPENQRENALTFNLASLYFYQKKYDQVIRTLQSVEYDDYTYNLNSKVMLITTYFESGETDALFFLFDSFRAFLNRNTELPEIRKSPFRHFISFTKKIAKLGPRDKKGREKLMLELEAIPNVASRAWLQEKLAEA